MVNVPPRSLKSVIISQCLPAWCWVHHPEWAFLCAAYTANVSIENAVNCRRIIESDWYRGNWGAYALTSDQNTKSEFENSMGGRLVATSVGGRALGKGFDWLLVDDPHDREKVGSERDTERVEVAEWWDKTLSTRANNPKTAKRTIIMQRLHRDDLCGHILRKELGWVHLRIPGRYERALHCKTPIWEDPRTDEGQLLHPDRVPEEELAKLEAQLGDDARGQIQQDPAPPGGGMFKPEWWQGYCEYDWLCPCGMPKLPEKIDGCGTSWDLSVKAKSSNDPFAGGWFAWAGANIYVIDIVSGRLPFTQVVPLMREFVGKHQHLTVRGDVVVVVHLVEDKAAGPFAIEMLKDDIPGLLPINPKGSKEARAKVAAVRAQAGQIWLPMHAAWTNTPARPGEQSFVDELRDFPAAIHDDRVDALSQLVTWQHQTRFVEGIA